MVIMVSLDRNNQRNLNSSARFFTEAANMDDEPILTATESQFKKLRTVPAFSLHLLISLIISIVGIILAATWKGESKCEPYFIMLYLRAVFWVITFFFDHYVKHQHENLRMQGYHDFHRALNVHKGIPLYIVTLWNTTIMAVQALMQHYYGDHFAEQCIQHFLTPTVYVTLFSVLETIVLCLVNGTYIAKVVSFNETEPVPDALRGTGGYVGSVGLTQRYADFAELFEKQADLINYLQDHNFKLNQKLMQINARFGHHFDEQNLA